MKAVVLRSNNRLALEEVPKPTLLEDSDVLVRVTTAAICGSDLHAKHGLIPGLNPGTVIGHEFVGFVEEVGSSVSKVKKGDRVAACRPTVPRPDARSVCRTMPSGRRTEPCRPQRCCG